MIYKSTTEKIAGKQQSKLFCLREKLRQKAKKEPKYKFYSLYGHLSRQDVLQEAWKRCKAKGGSPGIDGITFKDIENTRGSANFLEEIKQSLIDKTYKPMPVKRVYIPKPNGKLRPLGIPCIKDRVVQMAALLILEPIFEEDFLNCSYGFRPGKSAHQSIEEIRRAVNQGKIACYDADLKGYFDSIPHDKLMKALQFRISDRQILKLIRMWLQTPISENGNLVKAKTGTPQGGVISPLLANIYLHWFDKVFYSKQGPANWANAKLVRYADDYVVLAKYISPKLINFIEDKMEKRLGLIINREKTKVVEIGKGEILSFLGYSFKYIKSRDEKMYCYSFPSKDAVKRACQRVKELTSPKAIPLKFTEVIRRLDKFLIGWGNYFSKGYPSKSLAKVSSYTERRLIRHAKRRSHKGYRMKGSRKWGEFLKEMGFQRISKERLSSNA